MNANNASWNNFIKKRTCDQLLSLYNNCLVEKLMYIPRKFRQDSIYMMNTQEKQLHEKLNLEKLEILTTTREHFKVKLDSIDNDFNKWLEEKKLSEEIKNNILSEWQKNLENVNKQSNFGKIISKEKEMFSKKTKKDYKRDLKQHLNH